MTNVFAVPIFFICFRESLETSIIVSVLLAFLQQTLGHDADAAIRKRLARQVWSGVALGVFLCLIIGGALIAVFYTVGRRSFAAAEYIWEGVLGIVASVIITIMGVGLLRVNKLQDKWKVKIAKTLEAKDSSRLPVSGRIRTWLEKYFMFLLPFVTVMREGIEAVLFIAGVGVGLPATSFPLAVACGFAAGILVGYLIYRSGNSASLQIFLVVSTCFLYLVAAGLFSKGVWDLEMDAWAKFAGEGAVEAGSGPGSYDIRKSVWHVNCCNPSYENGEGGWGLFNSLFGWQNSATYGSVISYNMYWLAVIAGFGLLSFKERNDRWPFQSQPAANSAEPTYNEDDDSSTHNKPGGAARQKSVGAQSTVGLFESA